MNTVEIKNIIIQQLLDEYPDIPEKRLFNIRNRLNKETADELERTADVFERFGCKAIMDNIRK